MRGSFGVGEAPLEIDVGNFLRQRDGIEIGRVGQDDHRKVQVGKPQDVGSIAGIAAAVPDPPQTAIFIDKKAGAIIDLLAAVQFAFGLQRRQYVLAADVGSA